MKRLIALLIVVVLSCWVGDIHARTITTVNPQYWVIEPNVAIYKSKDINFQAEDISCFYFLYFGKGITSKTVFYHACLTKELERTPDTPQDVIKIWNYMYPEIKTYLHEYRKWKEEK